jgi:threonine synthase
VHLKVEGLNPTGSFKDRGMTMAMSKALEAGAKVVICASTGNTSASAAAYAARAGLVCAVLIPEGQIALGKLAQALIHGARVVPVRGTFDRALEIVRELGERPGVEVVNSVNPARIEGQKTAVRDRRRARRRSRRGALDPSRQRENITAYWKGYCEYAEPGRHPPSPHARLAGDGRGAARAR